MTDAAPTLADPSTPFAVLDIEKARRNAQRLTARLAGQGVLLRPHVKTAKSVPVARLMLDGATGPITVSTLHEAEAFADAGYHDILYAVGIDPHKLPRVVELARRGVVMQVLLDTLAQARAVTEASTRAGVTIPALIEVDCDGHRGGVDADGAALLEIGAELARGGDLGGVLTHAGESYFAATPEARRDAAHHERDVAVHAADRLRAAGHDVATVSFGSTPTAHAADDLSGVTEVRAGNYVFFDLVMAGIGVCDVDDIALSVVVTIIGRTPSGDLMTDGGWMALSRDRGTAVQERDQGYGLVADLDGRMREGLLVTGVSQEHGIIGARDGAEVPDLPVGARLRILPNHACATASQHDGYHVIEGGTDVEGAIAVGDHWERLRGW
ncbi:alanine racemase [Microbacterium sp. EST19A]|uniref:alanine racemase n=1 Tax=Microbacterium sp. EST19A TaxID=2862681 RepID=UPI001CC1000F|nr:alanine racemase [Microbacterium sp. EST19A]